MPQHNNTRFLKKSRLRETQVGAEGIPYRDPRHGGPGGAFPAGVFYRAGVSTGHARERGRVRSRPSSPVHSPGRTLAVSDTGHGEGRLVFPPWNKVGRFVPWPGQDDCACQSGVKKVASGSCLSASRM